MPDARVALRDAQQDVLGVVVVTGPPRTVAGATYESVRLELHQHLGYMTALLSPDEALQLADALQLVAVALKSARAGGAG